ncbi:MAG: hypothetical protein ACLTC1_02265 [Turicibacter sp.]
MEVTNLRDTETGYGQLPDVPEWHLLLLVVSYTTNNLKNEYK